MREIKFRGKRITDGKWIYGDLIHEKDKLLIRYLHPEGQYISYEIIPETVGQYTGLKDKNGKEIYEGNIVKIYCRNYTHEGYEADFPLCDIGVIEYSNCMSFEVKMKNDHYSTILLDCKHTGEEFWFEKVSNIYDNPELLGVE